MYRWWFERRWGDGDLLCWVGLNPGTGDTDAKPRPSLRKVTEWAEAWGLEGVVVVNLFAYRATNPKELRSATVDIVGEHNDEEIRRATRRCAMTLAAWGAGGDLHGRGKQVTSMLVDPVCVGVTKNGESRHPLYVPGATTPLPYRRP